MKSEQCRTGCPTRAELRRYCLGDLPAEQVEVIAKHLDACEGCCELLPEFARADDTMIASLRTAHAVPEPDASCQRLIDRVATFGSSWPGSQPAAEPDGGTGPPPGLKEFCKAAVAAGLVSAEQLARVRSALPSEPGNEVKQLTAELVKCGTLTAFQAEVLGGGKSTPLLIDEYVLLERIGAGSMGEVFKARHRRMDRLVAIKLLSRSLCASAKSGRRFSREMRAVAALEHPNIVAALDAGEAGGVLYLVMQYVAGSDLSRHIKLHGPLDAPTSIDLVCQAAAGLEHAHEQHVIHRDIKPANLLLDVRGTVRILDFGLARRRPDEPRGTVSALTVTGNIVGTVDYMAPEQADDPRSVDGRADIYSLGCTLHYLLTGRAAYPGGSALDRLTAHREAPLPILAGVPESLNRVFQQMIAKRPADRQESMSEVIAQLQDCRNSL